MNWKTITIPSVILLITVVLCYILSCPVDIENFGLKYYKAVFSPCPVGMQPLGDDSRMCIDAETKKTCTTDPKRWLETPLCPASTTGEIKARRSGIDRREQRTVESAASREDFYVTDFTPQESLSTAGYYSPVDFSGDGDLPKTTLTTKKPENNIKLYNGLLITPSKSADFATYVRDNKPYLVTPSARFNSYDDQVIAIGDDYTSLGDTVPQSSYSSEKFPRIQDQWWYLDSDMNPFKVYQLQFGEKTTNGRILTVDDRVLTVVYKGKPYVFWADSCGKSVTNSVVKVTSDNQIYQLMPTARTFHHFTPAYKQPWFKEYLVGCEVDNRYK